MNLCCVSGSSRASIGRRAHRTAALPKTRRLSRRRTRIPMLNLRGFIVLGVGVGFGGAVLELVGVGDLARLHRCEWVKWPWPSLV